MSVPANELLLSPIVTEAQFKLAFAQVLDFIREYGVTTDTIKSLTAILQTDTTNLKRDVAGVKNDNLYISSDVIQLKTTAQQLLRDLSVLVIQAASGAGSTDLLIEVANQKNQRFLNELWVNADLYLDSGSTDNTNQFKAAVALARSLGKGIRCAPRSTAIVLNDDIDLTGIRYIDIKTDIVITAEKTITVGGFARTAPVCDISFYAVTNGTSPLTANPPTNPVIRVVGLKNSWLKVGNCNYLQLYADAADTTKASTAYNDITLIGVISKFQITDSGAYDNNGLGGWVNENRVWGGRIIRNDIAGVSYTHNHNKYYNNTFEGSTVNLTFSKTNSNTFYGMRIEDGTNTASVSFAADTMDNKLYQTWSGSGSPRSEFAFSANVTDLGQFNICTTEAACSAQKTEIFNVQGNQLVSDGTTTASQNHNFGRPKGNLSGVATHTPYLSSFGVTANRMVALSNLIPVQRGDVVKFDADYDGSLLRPLVWCYDANQKLITDETAGLLILLVSGVFNGENYNVGANLSAAALNIGFSINRADVRFVQVGCYAGVAGVVRSVTANLWTQNLLRSKSTAGATQRIKLPQLAGDVTKGYVPVGYQVYNSTFKTRNHVIFAFETRLTAAVASAGTSITIDSATGIKNGDIVGIQLDDGTTHWTKVSALSGTNHTVDAMPSVAALGNRVVYNRWAVINYSATLASATYAQGTTTLVYTVAGAAIGQKVTVGHNKSLGALFIKGDVTATDTVTVYIYNPTATGIPVAGGSIYVSVE